MTTVLVAVAQPLVRSGLAMMLEAHDALALAAEVGHGEELSAAVLRSRPDVVLLDLALPGPDPVTLIAELPGDPKVVVLATYPDDPQIDRALVAGACGFVLRSAAPEEMLAVLSP